VANFQRYAIKTAVDVRNIVPIFAKGALAGIGGRRGNLPRRDGFSDAFTQCELEDRLVPNRLGGREQQVF
jgi:hypothetical protein